MKLELRDDLGTPLINRVVCGICVMEFYDIDAGYNLLVTEEDNFGKTISRNLMIQRAEEMCGQRIFWLRQRLADRFDNDELLWTLIKAQLSFSNIWQYKNIMYPRRASAAQQLENPSQDLQVSSAKRKQNASVCFPDTLVGEFQGRKRSLFR